MIAIKKPLIDMETRGRSKIRGPFMFVLPEFKNDKSEMRQDQEREEAKQSTESEPKKTEWTEYKHGWCEAQPESIDF